MTTQHPVPLTEDKAGLLNWRRQFGSRLGNCALELGLSGADIARRVGVKPKTYNNYVTGERLPPIYELPKIAAALETTVEKLLDLAPTLSGRDHETYVGMHRFNNAAGWLSPGEIHFLADVAETIKYRRDSDQRKARSMRPAVNMLALAFETVLPAIVRNHAPQTVETITQARDDGYDWLDVSLVFPPRSDPKALTKAIADLAVEGLGVQRTDVEVSSMDRGRQGVVITLKLRAGPSASRQAD